MAMALVNVSGSCNCTVSVVSRHRAVELVFGTEACAQVCGINMYALKDQHHYVSCAGSYYIMHIQDPNERRGLRRCSRCVTPSEWRRWRPGPANSYFGRFEGPRLQIRESEYIIGDPTFNKINYSRSAQFIAIFISYFTREYCLFVRNQLKSCSELH